MSWLQRLHEYNDITHVEGSEKRRLLRQYTESNLEYRLAIQRCRVCRTLAMIENG